MNESYRCGDGSELVAYLYGDCDPAQRQAIAAHVAACPRCADELEALGAARQALAAWSPPDTALGFRIASDAGAGGGVVLPAPRRRWWQDPLPAWAQLAAAVVIFVAGLAAGSAWGTLRAAATEPAIANLQGELNLVAERLARMEQQPAAPVANTPVPVRYDTRGGRYVTEQELRQVVARSEDDTRRFMADVIAQLVTEQSRREYEVENRLVNITDQRLQQIASFVSLARNREE